MTNMTWVRSDENGETIIRTESGHWVANLGLDFLADEDNRANIVAAAPDLLAALECVLVEDMIQYLPAEYVAIVRAAIAKARGQ